LAIPAHITGDRVLLEEVSRLQSQTVCLTDRAILCRVLGKYLLFADADDRTVTPHVALNGCWESWTTLAIARALRPGVHAVDVGANHGYFTLLMADAAGRDGRVLAIEPNPRLAELIGWTMAVNGYSRCASVLSRAAATFSHGAARLVVPRHRSADASIVSAPAASDEVLSVETISIDDATKEFERVDFIKIDAEGAEEAIWGGMGGTLRHNPNIIVVMEFKPASYANAAAFLARIRAEGFPLRCIGYDAAIEVLTDSEALGGGPGGDRMLFLQRLQGQKLVERAAGIEPV
jgi:FkbM family methyltransferase